VGKGPPARGGTVELLALKERGSRAGCPVVSGDARLRHDGAGAGTLAQRSLRLMRWGRAASQGDGNGPASENATLGLKPINDKRGVAVQPASGLARTAFASASWRADPRRSKWGGQRAKRGGRDQSRHEQTDDSCRIVDARGAGIGLRASHEVGDCGSRPPGRVDGYWQIGLFLRAGQGSRRRPGHQPSSP